jgi:hypothetical protein
MTSAEAPTSMGTIEVNGVKNMAIRNSTPVTAEARPVFAPPAMPEALSI